MEPPRTTTAGPRSAAAFVCLLALLFAFTSDVFGLKGVQIHTPEAIRAGESLRLKCDYDLDGVPLYSIKWYFGDQEFYRFVPKESPPTRVFPLSGTTTVDISESDDHQVLLTNLPRDMSGHYKCEVSADGPLFHTQIKESFITIIEEPPSQPLMFAGKLKYSKDEPVRINCTSYSASPATNLTWFINNKKVNNSTKYVKTTSWVLNETEGLQTSKSRLELEARPIFFPSGRMTVRCESNQFQLYTKYSSIELTDDSPRLAQMVSPTVHGTGGHHANSADRFVTIAGGAFSLVALTAVTNRIASTFSR
ncbi:Immunoglobulin-like domain,Immunoglobulin-like fold,CD80-like, immunoglobulin C2-set [Cinara cedri]|uniref:Immunoglobulin-like domain,Immunoglobulin-like fold,CD80-like, immunoglobulin C2-set n=1 Tax=Cinara cedri TaxID=506608 RepID=A0A5E4N7Z4_9HEMI|nr:Immunoglobulin-like domain,Immunoglobulin-like fold,CD80-like, immunoglobulin C2-set [Cinara cedri]